MNLSGVSVMNYLNAYQARTDPHIPGALREMIEAVDNDTRALKRKKITVRAPRIRIVNNREGFLFWDQGAEVYVVTLALDTSGRNGKDLSGQGLNSKAMDVVPVFKEVKQSKSRYVNVHRTPQFHNVRDNDALPLSGGGIVLYGPIEPLSDLVELHGVIAEGDEGYRKLGGILEEAADRSGLQNAVGAVADVSGLAVPQLKAVESAFWLTFQLVVSALKNNGDDVIGDFHISFLRHLNWNVGIHSFREKNFSADIIAEMS